MFVLRWNFCCVFCWCLFLYFRFCITLSHSIHVIRDASLYIIWLIHIPSLNDKIEPVHEISNNVVCAPSKASDQPAHTRSLIRAFACCLSILWLSSYWLNTISTFLSLTGGCRGSSESTLVKMSNYWKYHAAPQMVITLKCHYHGSTLGTKEESQHHRPPQEKINILNKSFSLM